MPQAGSGRSVLAGAAICPCDYAQCKGLYRLHACFLLQCLAVVSLLFIASPGSAQTFYISGDAGSDAASGESWQAAWKTLERATRVAKGGDTVIVRKSRLPYAGFSVNQSGTEQQPFVFKGEVPGDPPVISGAAKVISWEPTGTVGVWKSVVPREPLILTVDGVPVRRGSAGTLGKQEWNWAAGALLYRPTSGSPADSEVFRTDKPGGIKLKGVSWVTISDFAIQHGAGPGINIESSDRVSISRVRVRWHWQGIRVFNGAHHNSLEDCEVEGNREGIYLTTRVADNRVLRCKAFRNGNAELWGDSKGDRGGILIGEAGPNPRNSVEACESAYNGGPNSDPAVIAYKAPDSLVKDNYVHDNFGSGIFVTLQSDNSQVIGNRVIDNGRQAVAGGYKGISGLSVRRSSGVLISNNVVTGNYVSPDSRWPKRDLGPKGGLDVQGNSNDVMPNIRLENNKVSGTVGGPNVFISKVPRTPGLRLIP